MCCSHKKADSSGFGEVGCLSSGGWQSAKLACGLGECNKCQHATDAVETAEIYHHGDSGLHTLHTPSLPASGDALYYLPPMSF